jgi:DNA-directed RNA polymerase specialized sigma24 family protein
MSTPNAEVGLLLERLAADREKWVRLARTLGCPSGYEDDAFAEALLKACERRWQFRGESKVQTWFSKIFRNCISDQRRRAGRRKVALDRLRGASVETGDAGASSLPSEDSSRAMFWSLFQLSPKLHEAAALCLWVVDARKVASALGLGLRTTRVALCRAHAALREVIHEAPKSQLAFELAGQTCQTSSDVSRVANDVLGEQGATGVEITLYHPRCDEVHLPFLHCTLCGEAGQTQMELPNWGEVCLGKLVHRWGSGVFYGHSTNPKVGRHGSRRRYPIGRRLAARYRSVFSEGTVTVFRAGTIEDTNIPYTIYVVLEADPPGSQLVRTKNELEVIAKHLRVRPVAA